MIMDCSEQQQKCKKNNNIPYNQANRRHPPIYKPAQIRIWPIRFYIKRQYIEQCNIYHIKINYYYYYY